MNVSNAATKLGLDADMALFLFRKLDGRVWATSCDVRPGDIDQVADALRGIGQLCPMWVARGEGEPTPAWIKRCLRAWMLSEWGPKDEPEPTEQRTETRARVMAPASRESKPERERQQNPFASTPAPIKYPAPEAGIRNTRLLVTIAREQAAALLHTESEPTDMPWETFDLVIQDGLGWLAQIRCTERRLESVSSTGEVVIPANDIWGPQRKMIENILYGVCHLVAEHGAERPGYPGAFLAGEGERPRAVDILTGAAMDIDVDLREETDAIVREAERQLCSPEPGASRKIGRSALVRGHFAQQPCGPGGSLRRKIWRRPHYSPRLGLMRARQNYRVVSDV